MPESRDLTSSDVYVFRAALVGFRGVSRKLGVRSDQTLVDVHKLLQKAFEWDDDHPTMAAGSGTASLELVLVGRVSAASRGTGVPGSGSTDCGWSPVSLWRTCSTSATSGGCGSSCSRSDHPAPPRATRSSMFAARRLPSTRPTWMRSRTSPRRCPAGAPPRGLRGHGGPAAFRRRAS